jgi:signal transduction histidine kinase
VGLARPRRLRFLPLAPLAVVVLGVATALVVAFVGVGQLSEQGSRTAEQRARLLATTLAARLAAIPEGGRGRVLDHAAERSGEDLLLVRGNGTVLEGSSVHTGEPGALARWIGNGRGEVRSGDAVARYHASALPAPDRDLSVIALVRVPGAPRAEKSMVWSVAALTWLLVGAAALVALAIARDVRADVQFVRERIIEMARDTGEPAGKSVPVRGMDQIGLLTAAFNSLVERFTAAELAYRHDLAGAMAYDRDRSAFLAALSHELRTPLNAILGFTDVLLSEVDGPLSDDSRENLEVVRSSGQHLRDLIDDILELSALESGELKLSSSEVDVLSIAEEIVREARVNVQDKPVDIRLEGESEPVWGDARRIRQILGNVVDNAVKFTSEGSVEVRISADSERWTLVRVTDTGPGIPEEDRNAIFEEYHQVGDVGQRRAGTGLGLAITRRLVQMHGGMIDLESEVGEGSCFSIWLPRDEASARAARADDPEEDMA